MSVKIITADEELKNIENTQLKRLIVISRIHALATSPFDEELQQAMYKCWLELANAFLTNADLRAVVSRCEQFLRSKYQNNILAQSFIDLSKKLL
jgi:hypothetical protein